MRDLPAALAAHLDQTSTTTCHAWRLTRADGLVMGFTEHDRDLEFAGTVFSAATGFRASEVETGLGLEADAANLAGAFSDAAIDPNSFLPGKTLSHFRYTGSLTTPPCTEGLNWFVMRDPLTVGTGQVMSFSSAVHGTNNRAVQPLNMRTVYQYTQM